MTKVSNENQDLHFTSTVEEDPKTGEMIIQLPDALISQLGWGEDTYLVWEVRDQAIYLRAATPEEIAESK